MTNLTALARTLARHPAVRIAATCVLGCAATLLQGHTTPTHRSHQQTECGRQAGTR